MAAKLSTFICSVVTLLCSFTGRAESSNTVLDIYTEPSPPYHYLDSENRVVGSATHLVDALVTQAGVTANTQVLPWARAYRHAMRNPNALIYSLAKTPQRESQFHWLTVVSEFRLGFVSLSAREDITINDWNDLARYSVVVQREDIGYHWLKSQGYQEGADFIVCADIVCSWERLSQGKVDLIIEDPSLLGNEAAKFKLYPQSVKMIKLIPELSVDGYLAANKNIDPEILAKLQQAVRQLASQN